MALDFLGDIIGAATNPYGTPSAGQWNLTKGVFTDKATGQQVIFFYEISKGEDRTQRTALDSITDSGGRRLIVYEYPFRDGQQIRDLGRKGETFVFNIKFHGLNYQQLFNDFVLFVTDSPDGGTITHPVRGAIPVRFDTWEFVHRHDEWNAVTIKATFKEDNTDEIAAVNLQTTSQDSALRSALQSITTLQSEISSDIFEVGALLNIPAAIQSAINARLTSIIGQVSRLLGQLAATFSSDAQLQSLAAQSSGLSGGASALSSGTVSTSATTAGSLPPVFQIGFDPVTQASINNQISAYVSANQITPQQAVFLANQARSAMIAAITEATNYFGNSGYDIVLQYRAMAIAVQTATEAAISTSQSQIKLFVTPQDMSLRQVAASNGLSYNRQNDIEALNPYLPSVNLIPRGTTVTVPVS